jgi:hypothetical protein
MASDEQHELWEQVPPGEIREIGRPDGGTDMVAAPLETTRASVGDALRAIDGGGIVFLRAGEYR